MGGRRDPAAALAEFFEDGNGQRRALDGVGAGAQLVDQDEGAVIRLLEDGDELGHVGGEGREGLLDALFVADVDEDILKGRDGRARSGRDEQPAHGHEGQKADGL